MTRGADPMREIISTVTSQGHVTLPAEVRRVLGLAERDKVAFVIDTDGVRVRPVQFTLAEVFGSVEPLPGTTTEDFERQIAGATDEAAERALARLPRP